jgi:hypothetical protein
VRLEPLYRVRFSYSGGWGADLAGPESSAEGLYFFLAEGRCEGRTSGHFRGANHPSRRGDGTFLPRSHLLPATGRKQAPSRLPCRAIHFRDEELS